MFFVIYFPPLHNCHTAESLGYVQQQKERLMGCFDKCYVCCAYEFYSNIILLDVPAADIVCSASPRKPLWDRCSQLLHCASQRQHI